MQAPFFATLLLSFVMSPVGAIPQSLPSVNAPVGVSSSVDSLSERIHHDRRGRSLWIRGRNYKAEASPEGFKFIPYLGSDAPQNYPVMFQLNRVRATEQEFPLAREGVTRRDGDRLIIDRGSVEEWYDARLDGVEQSFLIDAAGLQEDLEVFIDVETQMEFGINVQGVYWSNERGGVTYRKAIVRDDAGRQLELEVKATQDQIRLVVPQHFLQAAEGMVLVDPIIATFEIGEPTGRPRFQPDVAFDVTFNNFVFVCMEQHSVTDHDIVVEYRDADSNAKVGIGYLDMTDENWQSPSVASNNALDVFMLAALRVTGSGDKYVVARTFYGGLPYMSEIYINHAAPGVSTWREVDIGGMGQDTTANSHFRMARLLDITGGGSLVYTEEFRVPLPLGLGMRPQHSGTPHSYSPGPEFEISNLSISKSTGDAANSQWRICFGKKEIATGHTTIVGLRYAPGAIDLSGPINLLVLDPTHGLASLDVSDGLSALAGPVTGAPVSLLTAMVGLGGTQYETWLHGLDGNHSFGARRLQELEHRDLNSIQRYPSVGTTQDRFVVYYQEANAAATEFRSYYDAIDLASNGEFAISERRIGSVQPGSDGGTAIASRFSGGDWDSPVFGLAATAFNGIDYEVIANTITANAPETRASQYCHGTPNSTGDYGFMTVFGNSDTTSGKTLQAEALPAGQFAYFLAGQGGMGLVYPPGSNGPLCLDGGPIGRYNLGNEIQLVNAAGVVTLDMDPSVLRGPSGAVSAMAGATWNFQAWHREAGGSSNFTNAASLLFE